MTLNVIWRSDFFGQHLILINHTCLNDYIFDQLMLFNKIVCLQCYQFYTMKKGIFMSIDKKGRRFRYSYGKKWWKHLGFLSKFVEREGRKWVRFSYFERQFSDLLFFRPLQYKILVNFPCLLWKMKEKKRKENSWVMT